MHSLEILKYFEISENKYIVMRFNKYMFKRKVGNINDYIKKKWLKKSINTIPKEIRKRTNETPSRKMKKEMNRNKQNLILKWWEPHGAAPRSLRDLRRLPRVRHRRMRLRSI